MSSVHGLHHVTAIADDPQRNLAFYTGVLGMRLVKRTVNQDDPHTYHLFYADAEGNPGTDLTFFAWPGRPHGREGSGMATEVGLAVAEGSLPYWIARLGGAGVEAAETERFGESVVTFTDPDGLGLALYGIAGGAPGRDFIPWSEGPVPAEHQIRGLHVARLLAVSLKRSARFLTDTFGYESVGEEGGWHRFAIDGGGSGRILDVSEAAGEKTGRWGPGTVHHVAFRVADDDEHLGVREAAAAAGRQPTDVIDRFWFRAIYFREPGGVLFEVATDGPGFAVDEDRDALGGRLILPPWLEPRRGEIDAALPDLGLEDPPS
jgi:glyoxalase family protein